MPIYVYVLGLELLYNSDYTGIYKKKEMLWLYYILTTYVKFSIYKFLRLKFIFDIWLEVHVSCLIPVIVGAKLIVDIGTIA